MSAGASAQQQAQRLSSLARIHELEAKRVADEAARYAAAARAEKALAKSLAVLGTHGYHLLADRQWPGSRNAQLDFVVVGPSGVWIIDSKHWNDFSVAGGSMFRGQDDVTDEVLRLADVANDAEATFAEIGLAPGEVHVLLAMHDHRGHLGEVGPVRVVGATGIHQHLTKQHNRLTTAQVEQLLAVAMKHFAAYSGPQREELVAVVSEPVLDEELNELALLTEDEVREALTEAELAEPIEDWMVFLHPEQAKLVRRTFNGPARIRGAAGTGKTVVGLHRAAYLARMHPQGRVLFTTFVKTLPAVMSNLLARMAPEAAERVEFTSVHSLAARIARERGVRLNVQNRQAGELLRRSWGRLAPEHRTRLAERAGNDRLDYWKEEVEAVIKGRGLTTFEQYADCARPGRLIRLNNDDRRAVWALFTEYSAALREAGIHDFNDQVLLAESALAKKPHDEYAAVIIDEAQDLSLSMVRMLHRLVGDRPDAFTLIGDGRQNVYPGGYVLSEAGISLAGRGVVLDRNYRNTIEVQEFATALIADSAFIDMEELGAPAPETTSMDGPVRHGATPVVATFSSPAEHNTALVEAVRQQDCAVADVAILCNTTREVENAIRLLSKAGIPAIPLLDYVGEPVDAVKIGTIKRAKGLEFKSVLLPWTPAGASSADEERVARDLRERYVAATRARDSLWVGVVSG
jgi:hypothetical protein